MKLGLEKNGLWLLHSILSHDPSQLNQSIFLKKPILLSNFCWLCDWHSSSFSIKFMQWWRFYLNGVRHKDTMDQWGMGNGFHRSKAVRKELTCLVRAWATGLRGHRWLGRMNAAEERATQAPEESIATVNSKHKGPVAGRSLGRKPLWTSRESSGEHRGDVERLLF